MNIEHLPRAEKMLKDYVDSHVTSLITSSEMLARKYLDSRQDFVNKSKANEKAKR
jgi:hypothetical protein